MTDPRTMHSGPPFNASGEAELIQAALAGNGLAYRRLVEPHLAMLHRIATRMSGNAALAEDAVQETLTLAFNRLKQYRPTASFKSYLAAIAATQAKTLARSERRREKREEGSAKPYAAAKPDEQLEGSIAAKRVRQALASMPDKRRRAATLRLDGGLSYKEIADALNSSEGSTRVLVHKALGELKEKLADLL
jgi:RNA polymerase sigma-70 factor, ECF subfamily